MSNNSHLGERYKIWSVENGKWWFKDEFGFTSDFEKAHVYSFDEAVKIVEGCNHRLKGIIKPSETMVKIN